MPGLKDFNSALKSSKVGQRTRKRAEELGEEYEPSAPRRRKKARGRRRRIGSGTRIGSRISAEDRKKYGTLDDEAEKVGQKTALAAGKEIGRLAGTEAGKKFLGRSLGTLSRAGMSGSVVGLAIAAGLAAYGLTAYAIRKLKERKEGRDRLAFEASQAYRHARMVAAEKKGSPLTRPELDVLARAYKAELKKLGVEYNFE